MGPGALAGRYSMRYGMPYVAPFLARYVTRYVTRYGFVTESLWWRPPSTAFSDSSPT